MCFGRMLGRLRPRQKVHRRVGTLLLSLSLLSAPALANDHVLRVSATILPRCALTTGVADLRCTGADAKGSWRIHTAGGVVTIEF